MLSCGVTLPNATYGRSAFLEQKFAWSTRAPNDSKCARMSQGIPVANSFETSLAHWSCNLGENLPFLQVVFWTREGAANNTNLRKYLCTLTVVSSLASSLIRCMTRTLLRLTNRVLDSMSAGVDDLGSRAVAALPSVGS